MEFGFYLAGSGMGNLVKQLVFSGVCGLVSSLDVDRRRNRLLKQLLLGPTHEVSRTENVVQRLKMRTFQEWLGDQGS